MVPQKSQIPNPEQLDFFHINLKVGGKMITGDIAEDLEIPSEPELLAEAISKQPSMYYYWSSVAEVAKAEHERLKNRYDMWYAEKYLECKKELVNEVGKSGVTETMVKARIADAHSEEYAQFQEELLKSEYKKNILVLASKAFLEKGSSMINLLSWRKAHLNDVGRG